MTRKSDDYSPRDRKRTTEAKSETQRRRLARAAKYGAGVTR
jgi:hypothetical protein